MLAWSTFILGFALGYAITALPGMFICVKMCLFDWKWLDKWTKAFCFFVFVTWMGAITYGLLVFYM